MMQGLLPVRRLRAATNGKAAAGGITTLDDVHQLSP
jgi:hypothetical protein